jgi:hypothetical protein
MHLIVAMATPILLAAVLGITFFFTEGGAKRSALDITAFYARFCLIVGYAYVGLAIGSLWLLMRLGRLR